MGPDRPDHRIWHGLSAADHRPDGGGDPAVPRAPAGAVPGTERSRHRRRLAHAAPGELELRSVRPADEPVRRDAGPWPGVAAASYPGLHPSPRSSGLPPSWLSPTV